MRITCVHRLALHPVPLLALHPVPLLALQPVPISNLWRGEGRGGLMTWDLMYITLCCGWTSVLWVDQWAVGGPVCCGWTSVLWVDQCAVCCGWTSVLWVGLHAMGGASLLSFAFAQGIVPRGVNGAVHAPKDTRLPGDLRDLRGLREGREEKHPMNREGTTNPPPSASSHNHSPLLSQNKKQPVSDPRVEADSSKVIHPDHGSPAPPPVSGKYPVQSVASKGSPVPPPASGNSPVQSVDGRGSPVPSVASAGSPAPPPVSGKYPVQSVASKGSPVPPPASGNSPVQSVDGRGSPVPSVASAGSPVPPLANKGKQVCPRCSRRFTKKSELNEHTAKCFQY